MHRVLSIALVLAGCTSAARGPFDAGSCAAPDCAALAAPVLIDAHAGDHFLLARWNPGPANVTGYTVVATPASGAPLVFHTGETSLLASGLTNGVAYSVTVASVVAGGTGPASDAVTVTAAGSCARTFALHRSYATLASPSMVAIGDFDRDGLLDVAVTQAGGVGVFINDRTGVFLPRTDRALSATPTSLVSADFDLDGRADLVAGGSSTWILYSDGGVVDLGAASTMLAVPDVNGDGFPDLALANGDLRVAVNAADGGFDPSLAIAASGGSLVAAGDFGGNGLSSLAVASRTTASFTVFANAADGGQLAAPASYALGSLPVWIAAGDFDGDGLVDLAFPAENGQILIHRQDAADGGFALEKTVAPTIVPGLAPRLALTFLLAADLDLDNLADLAYTAQSQDQLGVILHEADGGFAAPMQFATGSAPASVAAGDLNGDGLPDLVVANSGANTISVFINVCAR